VQKIWRNSLSFICWIVTATIFWLQ